MPVNPRLRRLFHAALPALLAVAFAACSTAAYPNSVFTNATEFNREIGSLFSILIWLGTAVFVVVELLLLYTIWRFRRRSDDDRPVLVVGITRLVFLWSATPALLLAIIAVPSVRTIFRTQAKASADALQVEVVGHQWWWEFRYPQYKITTANELYLPVGRKVNFTLHSNDVIHSFSIPRLGGKRDLIANHTNYLWFTPDSVSENAFNGSCNEYCGASHANMRFRAFTVTPAEFEQWTIHQKSPAVFGATPAAGATTAPVTAATTQGATQAIAQGNPQATAATPAGAPVTPASYTGFTADKLPAYTVPTMPIPDGITFTPGLTGDAARGQQIYSRSSCIGCHAIAGNPMSQGVIGPNLTHVGSRLTIAAGLYPNDEKHLALWIKNARVMKPGVIMPTLGKGEFDPVLGTTLKSGLSDQEIADIVAYLHALK
jgi:cytochrome c oxidase subunit 2